MKPFEDADLVVLQQGLERGPLEMGQERTVASLLSQVQCRNPIGLVRFGEGEGRVLSAEWDDAESLKIAANKLKRQTGRRYGRDDVLRIESMLIRAFDQAGVVGLRGSGSLNPEHHMPEFRS